VRNDAGSVDTWIGRLPEGVGVLLLRLPYPESDVAFVVRLEAAAASAGSDCPPGAPVVVVVGGIGAWVEPVGGANIASMLGRNAAPKGVERKSAGKSGGGSGASVGGVIALWSPEEEEGNAPLIHSGIEPPVRNPMQSSVNVLQLKSIRLDAMSEHSGLY
jgi:hypothetical protein